MSERWLTGGALLAAIAVSLFAQDARQIIDEAQKRARSKSQHYEGTLEAHDPKSKASTRRWTFDRLESSGESKSLLRFTAPPELMGVALLIVKHANGYSEQWMWTPAVGRERRIALQDRSTRFFGTDFSFEDLEERDVNQFEYKPLGEDIIDGAACWKMESKPKRSKWSQYTSSTLWVRKDNYVVAQIENFKQVGLVRKIHYSGIARQDGIATARNIEVWDAVRNSRTVLRIDKLQYNLPLKAEDFTVEALRRNGIISE